MRSTITIERTTTRGWAAAAAAAIGIFCVVTAELLPVGLLTPIASDLEVSAGTAGLLVTVPGLVAAATAPVVVVGAGRIDRRVLLAILLGLSAVSHLVALSAPNFGVMLVGRVLTGVSIGGYWAIAAGLAPRLVAAHSVPRATAIVFSGVAAASVLGVPSGTALGDLTDWRVVFAGLAGLSILVAGTVLLTLPPLPARVGVSPHGLLEVCRDSPALRYGLLITAALVTGHFMAFTFVRPVLTEVSGLSASLTGSALLAYGVAGIIGNFAAATLVARNLPATVVTVASGIAVALTAFALLPGGAVTGVAALLLWGLAYGGVSVATQTWVLRAAPQRAEAATAVNVAIFNATIAVGAALGGVVVNTASVAAVLWCAAGLVAVAVPIARYRRSTVS